VVVVLGGTVVLVVLVVVVVLLDVGTAAGAASVVAGAVSLDFAGRHGGLPACGGGPLASTMGAKGDAKTGDQQGRH
jgi:hypothetical protein